MDRIALALIVSGLVVILSIVATVLGGTQGTLADLTAPGAALGGLVIVSGLAILERRAFLTVRRVPGRPVSA
ncbi:hypothetical protein EAH89_04935 [Roseomonas nepalensis]|uniref:Uncharacterized protein n=1 Tax=Muricoccus nepalensis TaxID=1854500 RepID=A0A502GBX2_9PROT|nr:hypothetical protein [Roseomonas nepalensis]TPG59589.1 hypothetical protein EAH89_04935 [Roseomonas nepalensis]